jgi:glycosyltransferase involved in cell wall biosynthesis
MKNVLILSDINFWEDCSGHRARLKALIVYLTQHVKLTVVNTGPAPKGIETKLKETYVAEFFVLEHKSVMSSNGYGRRLERLMGDRVFDVVIIEYIHSSYFLNFLNGDPGIILDMHDIISDRSEEFRKFRHGGAVYELAADMELEILGVYDHVMAICGPDKEKLDTLLGKEKVLLCPHPVSVCEHPLRNEVKNISFVASAYLPNRDGIDLFIKECWPAISARFPQIRLNIYGTVCQVMQRVSEPNIAFKGFTPDLEEIYRQADIMINPVRFGAGMKIKNVEAIAHGVPLITTTHGSRGLESAAGKAYLTADAPDEFIEALTMLIKNNGLRKRLSKQAARFAEYNFSADKCFAALLEAIQPG